MKHPLQIHLRESDGKLRIMCGKTYLDFPITDWDGQVEVGLNDTVTLDRERYAIACGYATALMMDACDAFIVSWSADHKDEWDELAEELEDELPHGIFQRIWKSLVWEDRKDYLKHFGPHQIEQLERAANESLPLADHRLRVPDASGSGGSGAS